MTQKLFNLMKNTISTKIIYAILSVIISVFLWGQHTEKIIEISINVNYINLSDNFIILKSQSDEKILANIQGKVRDLIKLKLKNLTYNINLNQKQFGNYETYINIYKLNKFNNLDIDELNFSKEKINYIIDNKIKKTIKIKFNSDEDTIVMNNYILRPNKIIFNGPESILKSLDFVTINKIGEKNIKDFQKVILEKIDNVNFLSDKIDIILKKWMP